MKVISTETREEAWLAAVSHLTKDAKNKLEYNLILEITRPASESDFSRLIKSKFNSFLIQQNLYPIETVAETIFPASLYKRYGSEGVYEKYPNEIYPNIRKISTNSRGTYALRLVRGRKNDGETINPLARIIDRLKSVANENTGIRCAYELSLDESDSIPINRNDASIMAFPCLSHLSFKLSHDRKELHLTALYRSQHFIKKAMGNLLGLARLQDFVCREVGLKTGTLVCHATYAKLDDEGMVKPFRHLVDSLHK